MRAPIGISALILSIALSACASEQGSDNAPAAAAPAPPPPVASAAPAPTGSVAAPGVSVAPPAPVRTGSGDVVVPGPARPINPTSDPRTEAERMSDIRAWDRCVMQAQAAGDSDPTRPQMSSPEDVCRQSLGMADRLAVPQMRERRSR